MADNVGISTGVDKTIATDDISSVHYQRVKQSLGADGVANDLLPASADSLAGTGVPASGAMLWNGSTWDRQRTNLNEVQLLASAARTATVASSTQTNYDHRGVYVVINVTSAPASSSTIIVSLYGFIHTLGGGYVVLQDTSFSILHSAGARNYVLLAYPGADQAHENSSSSWLNQVTAVPLPRSWNLAMTHSNAESWTYQAYAALIR